MKINKEKLVTVILCIIKTLIIIAIFCPVVLVGVRNQEKNIKTNYIEPYCAVRYEYNVLEYKQCKDLNPQQLIEYLTDEAKKEYEVPNMPVIKG